jgi:hypothetical protein
VDALRGTGGNCRSLLDLWTFKRDILAVLLLGDVPRRCHMDTSWLNDVVWAKMSTHVAWENYCGPKGDTRWQAGKPKHVLSYSNLVAEVVYGTTYDVVVKNMVRNNCDALAIESQTGVAEVLAVITESGNPSPEADTTAVTIDADSEDMANVIEIILPATSGDAGNQETPTIKTVNCNQLDEDQRRKVLRAKHEVENLVRANLQLIVKDSPNLRSDILNTSAGTAHGGPDPGTLLHTTTWRYVLIILDTKVMGESSSRPRLRMPPVNVEEVRRLVEVARGRHDTPVVDDDETSELQPGDMFLLLDGGRAIETQLLSPFQGKVKECRVCHIMLEQQSVRARYSRIRPGFMVHNLLENVRVVTAGTPKLAPRDRLAYTGDNSINVLGPVVMPPWERTWITTFKDKATSLAPTSLRWAGRARNMSACSWSRSSSPPRIPMTSAQTPPPSQSSSMRCPHTCGRS